MAVAHLAYTFDPIEFRQRFQAEFLHANQLNLHSLHHAAAQVVSNATDRTRRLLSALRFDDQWLDTSSDSPRENEWFILVFSSHLIEATSLSNRFKASWQVLQWILPDVGWASDQVRSLTFGRNLHSLIGTMSHKGLASTFSGLDQYGGWLDLDTSVELRDRLIDAAPYFHRDSYRPSEPLASLATHLSRSPKELIEDAYLDSLDMLGAAIERTQDLFLVLYY